MTKLSSRKKPSSKTLYLILFVLLAGGAGSAFFLFFEGEMPEITIESPQTYLGSNGVIALSVHDRKSGLRNISLSISQGDKLSELYSETFPRKGSIGVVGLPEKKVQVAFVPGKAGFKDGPALLTVHASDHSFRSLFKGNITTITQEVMIDTTPPKITILHSERYINPGGSGVVIYRVDDPEAKNGLEINDDYHPGFIVGDGRDDTYIAFFALRYDAADIDKSLIIASDPSGNETRLPFSVIFKNKKYRQDRINVGNGFLEKKIPEFEQHYPQMQGPLVQKYLYTNNEVRQQNNKEISDLCNSPHPDRLWQERFLRMSGSTRAGYADFRTYFHNSKAIDKQVHLGIDIASTRHADVKAAEKGIVVYADYLGIYGNMVMLDHGQGVFSLYSHLSQINVSAKDPIDRGVVLGLTGTSGMAGGDHLHFSMLINGVFVTPKEWWDQHWIDVTIEEPLTESRFN